MDMASIQGALATIKGAGDLLKGIYSAKVSAEVGRAVTDVRESLINAQELVLRAQSEQSAMVERVRELEDELVRLKDWSAEKQRYALFQPYGGVIVYALKESMSSGEPPHYLCANCYTQGRKSHLQSKRTGQQGFVHLVCPACKAEAGTNMAGINFKYAAE